MDRNQVFDVDRWNHYQWSRFVDQTPEAQELLRQGARKANTFPAFVREVFARLYNDPRPLASTRPEDAWATKAHAELGELPCFDRLRDQCLGDRQNAGTAALELAAVMLEKMPSLKEDPQQLRDQIRGLMDFAKQASDAPELTAAIEKARASGAQAVKEAVEAANQVDPAELRAALRGACAAGAAAIAEGEERLDAFVGWGGHGVPTTTPADVKTALARTIAGSKKLSEIARLAGRLKRIACQKQATKAEKARSELTDIEQGRDLDRLLPSEIVKLSRPETFPEFARGFFEGSLLQYKLTGKEQQGEGPIVVCLDQSGSMAGKKEIWAKAFTMAILQVATMQHRDCVVIHYTDEVTRVETWSSPIDADALMRSMGVHENGGTSFEAPLGEALRQIRECERVRAADIVFITDGLCPVCDEFLEQYTAERKRLGVHCYAICVEAGDAPVLHQIADRVVTLADVANDSAATEILEL